jgi:hypothetical protein
MTNQPQTKRMTAGTIAILLMGWLELSVSLILFLSDLTAVAIVFAVASVLLAFFSTQLRRPVPWDTRPGIENTTADLPRTPFTMTMFYVMAVLGFVSLGGAVWMLIGNQPLNAVLMALWALSLGIQSFRFSPWR